MGEISIRKEPYGQEEFFNTVWQFVRKGREKEIDSFVDYASASKEYLYGKKEIVEDISFVCRLNYGGSEGIYLDVYAEKYTGNEMDRFNIGTVKSLNEDAETFEKMGQLFGRFVGKAKEFIQKNSVDFEFENTILVRSFDAEGNKLLGVYMETEDEASEYIAMKKYPKTTKTIKVYDLKKRTAKSLAA